MLSYTYLQGIMMEKGIIYQKISSEKCNLQPHAIILGIKKR